MDQGVRVRGLERAYDEHYALIELDADFPTGTVTALLGPNGAGKSTLISLLSSLSWPSAGTVHFGDKPMSEGVRHLIGYVGHKTMIYGELSARENLHFFGALYGVPDLKAKADALLDEVGLPRDKDRAAAGFSRGMAQRLALARALLPEPELLLLDEPFTGLDQEGTAQAVELLAARRDAGAVLVLASHDLVAADRLADRALILRRGRKAYEGPVEPSLPELYAQVIA